MTQSRTDGNKTDTDTRSISLVDGVVAITAAAAAAAAGWDGGWNPISFYLK